MNTTRICQLAVFDRKEKMVDSVLQTGERSSAVVEIEGVAFRSWMPQSAAERDRINEAGGAHRRARAGKGGS